MGSGDVVVVSSWSAVLIGVDLGEQQFARLWKYCCSGVEKNTEIEAMEIAVTRRNSFIYRLLTMNWKIVEDWRR